MTRTQIFTVRNSRGQFIAEYFAKDARQAIQKAVDNDASLAATFKKSHRTLIDPTDLTACVEAQSPYILERNK